MKRFGYIFAPMILAGALLLFGCASQGTIPFSPALGSSFQQVQNMAADKAIVYIYRPSPSDGLAGDFAADVKIPFNIKANGKVITTLAQGGYYVYITELGKIEFTAQEAGYSGSLAAKSPFSMTVDAKAGQAYYLKGAHSHGFTPKLSLVLISPEVGAKEIANCKLISTIFPSTSAPTTATGQAVATTNAYGEKIFVGKIEYTSRLSFHIPPGRTLMLSSDKGDKLTVFVSNDIAIRDMNAAPTRIGEKAEVKYSSATNGENEVISFRYVPLDYVQKPTVATQMALQEPASSLGTQVPVSVADGVKTIIGTVKGVSFVRGGMGKADLKLSILTEDGGENEFYVRAHSSMFITAEGQHTLIMQLPPQAYMRKRVAIEYSVIEDATGGLRLENGKNGVVSMRLVE